MFESLKSLLPGALEKRKPLERGVRAAVVLEAAREAVEAAFPVRFADLIVPTAFSRDVLTLTVPSPALSQEVRVRGAKFLEILNAGLGKKTVRRVRIRLARQWPEDVLS